MPSEDSRPRNAPDTAESYERAVPEKEPGLGQMSKTDNTPHDRPDSVRGSTRNDETHRELTADEDQNLADRVDPADPKAHGNRPDAMKDDSSLGSPGGGRGT